MLKINAIGNVTNDPELRRNESTGKTYCIIRIACDRRYRDRDGNKLTDFISVKVRDNLAELCVQNVRKGDKIAVSGDLEAIAFRWHKVSRTRVYQSVLLLLRCISDIGYASSSSVIFSISASLIIPSECRQPI